MAAWSDVVVDFGGEETINFGPRIELGTALYQLETHATISPRGRVTELPHVSACAAGEIVLVSGDHQLNVFANNCHEYLMTLDFESNICVMSVTDDGKYLAVAEQSGRLHLFDASNYLKLFSTKLEDAAEVSKPTFIEIVLGYGPEETNHILLVLTGSGRLHVFGMDLMSHCEAVMSKDQDRIKLIQDQTSHQIIDAVEFDCNSVVYATNLRFSGDVITVGSGDASAICLWKQENARFIPQCLAFYPSNEALGKCVVTSCERFLLTLNESHHLSLWSVDNFAIVWHCDTVAVRDFAVVNDEVKCQAVSILALTVELNGHCQATIFAIPSMECLYSVQLEFFVTLAYCSPALDGFYLVEGDYCEKTGSVSRLLVRSLTEALPESRLLRMLKKGNFDDAEDFAKQFELDLQLVYRAKASHLLQLLSPRSTTDLDEDAAVVHVRALEECFETITDDGFVVDCCVSAALPTLEMMRNLLEHVKTRMRKKTCSPEFSQLMKQATQAAHRLGTFQLMFGNGYYSGFKWEDFRHVDMLQELANCLHHGHMHAVSTMWNRHLSDFQHLLNRNFVERLLRMVPDETPSEKLRIWLSKGLIPFAVQSLPEALPVTAAWIGERAKNMEIMERPGWPRNALEFCELLGATFKLISASINQEGLLSPEGYAAQLCNLWIVRSTAKASNKLSAGDSFLRLQVLCRELSALCELHEQYNCRLTLADFQLESVESITYRMLDRVVAVELIPDAISKTLRPYMKQYGLDEDRMLYQYVGDLSQRCGKVVSCMGDAPWEAKAIQVIRCIKDLDFRCQALLNAMAIAHVPWSCDMETLVKETLGMYGCPRVTEIEEKCRMVELKKLLISYGLRNFNLAERSTAETLAYYVLSQDRPSALQDALHVVSFYPRLDEMHVYLFRAKFLVERGRSEELQLLFSGLALPAAKELGERFMTYCQLVLSSFFSKSHKALYCQACCDVIRLLQRLHADSSEQGDMNREILGFMESISSLQQEFGEYPSVEQYGSKHYRTELFKQNVGKVFGKRGTDNDNRDETLNGKKREQDVLLWNSERKRSKSNSSPNSCLYRLAELLNIAREDVCLELATVAISEDQVATAISVCKDLVVTVTDERAGPVLLKVARDLCAVALDADLSKRVPRLAPEVYSLAQISLSSVSSDLLLNSLQLCRITRIALATWNQCESGDYQSTVINIGKACGDSMMLPNVDDVFVEDGLVLDSARILPLVSAIIFDGLQHLRQSGAKYLQNWIQTPPETLSDKLDSLFNTTWKVIDYLCDNAQVELALAFAMESVALATEFLASHPSSLDQSDNPNPLPSTLLRNIGKLVNKVQEMLVGTLHKVFLSRLPDLPMAMACLCSLPKQVSFDCLKNLAKVAGFQYKRAGYIAQVGLAFTQLVKELYAQKNCQELADNARWGYQLAKLKISFREAFCGGKEGKSRLLPILVQSSLVTISDLHDYCVTFDLDEDQALLECMRHLMVAQDKDANGDVLVCTMPVEKVLARAGTLCKKIEKTENLVQVLDNILPQLYPCDYERIEFVLRELETLKPSLETSRSLKLLTCLKPYRSRTSPGGRLPFHPLITGSHWNVITPELNAESVDDWLPIASILGLQLDVVLGTAVRNIIEKYVSDKKPVNGGSSDQSSCWKEDGINQKLFDVISDLLTRISSCELAVSSAVWIIKKLPTGADKILALKCCVKMAQKWQAACPEGSADHMKALKTWTEHSAMHRCLMTQQILHNHRLAEPDLLTLSCSPAKLIFKLYEHPCITVGRDPLKLQAISPDIHSVAAEIAVANSVSIEKIRKVLVNQWLPSSLKHMQESADVSMEVGADKDVVGFTDGDVDEDEINLLRVIYLLHCKPTEETVLYLLNLAYGPDAIKTYLCRVRALRCLFALADAELVERLVPLKTVSQIRKEMKIFLYLAELEQIRMPQTLESFDKLSKEGLVRTIWRNHNHDVAAVALVSDLCLDYGIGDEQLWSCIIQQLLNFRCIARLCNLLDRLSTVPSIWHLPFMEPVLSSLTSSVLGCAVAPLACDKLSECLHFCSLVFRRPTAWTVETIDSWIQEFRRLELHACTLGCALLLPSGDHKQNLLKELLDPAFVSKVMQQLVAWTKTGYDVPLSSLVSEYMSGLNEYLHNSVTRLSEESRVKIDQTNGFLEDYETTVFE